MKRFLEAVRWYRCVLFSHALNMDGTYCNTCRHRYEPTEPEEKL